MDLDDFSKFMMSGGFLAFGAFLTAVRGRMTTAKQKNALHWIFYIVCGIIVLASVIGPIIYWNELFSATGNEKPKIGFMFIFGFALVSGILLFVFTKKHKTGRRQYRGKELDKIVNKFTSDADITNIRLLAGDLNFFGATPEEMNGNSQYTCLKKENFREVQIICFRPVSNQEKIRYGKLLTDMRVEIKFYHPQAADLNVRGRMKTLNRVPHLLIYNKVASGVYDLLELDTANSSGALYNHIWNLIWQLAEAPGQHEVQEYKEMYKTYQS